MSPLLTYRDVDALQSIHSGRLETTKQRPLPFQVRTCVRCGNHTTFVLEDVCGGWYVCGRCGAYA